MENHTNGNHTVQMENYTVQVVQHNYIKYTKKGQILLKRLTCYKLEKL